MGRSVEIVGFVGFNGVCLGIEPWSEGFFLVAKGFLVNSTVHVFINYYINTIN